ncbi:hypothetical protein AGDE_01153 [Angomonas deanei]|nr:hypothetical protein AGDE_01153 [Angomonas deanei]|eukprot:EPY42770.1 hypothetical protein AGDE_01153 [Angomonas deanei]
MIQFDLNGAINTLPGFSSVTNDHEKHTIFTNFLANVETELDNYVISRCSGFSTLAEVGELLEARKDEITDEVWEFLSDGCLDYVTFAEQWEKINP